MKVRAQFAFVFNLDKCIGCHLLGHLQNVWTNHQGRGIRLVQQHRIKPGIGYPKQWENQGLEGRLGNVDSKLQLKVRLKLDRLLNIFANPGHAGDRRLLRAPLHFRLRPPAETPAVEAARQPPHL